MRFAFPSYGLCLINVPLLSCHKTRAYDNYIEYQFILPKVRLYSRYLDISPLNFMNFFNFDSDVL
jgi:hypothetical protein